MAYFLPWRGLNVGDLGHPCSKASGGDCCEYLGQVLLNSFGTAIAVIIVVNALFLVYSKVRLTAMSCKLKIQQIKTKPYRHVESLYCPPSSCSKGKSNLLNTLCMWVQSYLLLLASGLGRSGGESLGGCRLEKSSHRVKKHPERNPKSRRAKDSASYCPVLGCEQGAETQSQSHSCSPQYPLKEEHKDPQDSCSSRAPTPEPRAKGGAKAEGQSPPHHRHDFAYCPGPGADRAEQPFSNPPAAPQNRLHETRAPCPISYPLPPLPSSLTRGQTTSPVSSSSASFTSSCPTWQAETPDPEFTPPLPPPPNYSPDCARRVPPSSSLDGAALPPAPPTSAALSAQPRVPLSCSTSFASDEESSFSSSSPPRCCPPPQGPAVHRYPYCPRGSINEATLQALLRGGPKASTEEGRRLGLRVVAAPHSGTGSGGYCNPYYMQEAVSESPLPALVRGRKASEEPPSQQQQSAATSPHQQLHGDTSPRQFPVYQDCPGPGALHHLNASPMRQQQPWGSVAGSNCGPPAAGSDPRGPIRICSTRHLRPGASPDQQQCPTQGGESEVPLPLPPCHLPQALPRRANYPRMGGGGSSDPQCPGQLAYDRQSQSRIPQPPHRGPAAPKPEGSPALGKTRLVVRYSGGSPEDEEAGRGLNPPPAATHPSLHLPKGQAPLAHTAGNYSQGSHQPPYYERH